ncbi:MAG: hypothetical protein ACRDVD_06555 [Acidimicrobiia bacterium]
MFNDNSGETFSDAAGKILGPVYDRFIEGVDVCLAGVGEVLMAGVSVTVREAAAVPGWVGVVDANLTSFVDFQLELRLPEERVPCTVMFSVGPQVRGRTLIRGMGKAPGVDSSPQVRSRDRARSGVADIADALAWSD